MTARDIFVIYQNKLKRIYQRDLLKTDKMYLLRTLKQSINIMNEY